MKATVKFDNAPLVSASVPLSCSVLVKDIFVSVCKHGDLFTLDAE